MSITPKNWDEFQHYKDRSPIWIKLHRKLLDNYDFHRLPVASKALAPLLWLLASEYEAGKITATNDEIAFRFRMPPEELGEALNPLIASEFFESDSKPLARRKRVAMPEKRERHIEKIETEREPPPKPIIKKQGDHELPSAFTPDFSAATAVGLSRVEADREFQRFKNHAAMKGRRCSDWQAAWRNWCIKAAEFMGKPPPKSVTATGDPVPLRPVGAPSDEELRKKYEQYRAVPTEAQAARSNGDGTHNGPELRPADALIRQSLKRL